MLRIMDRAFAASSSRVWGRVRDADGPASAAPISQRRGSPASSVGWVARSDFTQVDHVPASLSRCNRGAAGQG